MFFFFEQEDLPDFSKIKDIIKSLVPYELTAEKNLSDMDRQLSNHLQMLSVLMFTKRKAENKSFTINSTKGAKSFLRNVSVDEDSGNLSEDDSLKVSDIFHNNIEAFHELVAQCYISKTARDYKTDNEIFCVQCKSKYCKDDTDIFIINKHGNFFALADNNKSIDLKMFITDYFGPIEKSISHEFNEVAINKQLSHKEMQIEFSRIFNNLSDSIGKSHEFINGAITFFDFLGWKGLWQNSETKPLETVAELIDSFKENIKKMTFTFFPNIPVKMNISTLISISDTIAIFTPQVSDISKSKLLSLHADIARFILESSCKCRYPIRGAITYGKYSIMNNVMIGPGIDECASWHEKCDWVGAHFTPSAQFILEAEIKDRTLPHNILMRNDIPLKSGVPRVSYCVKWHIKQEEFDAMWQKVEAILPEIAAKYMNTYEFLKNTRGGDEHGNREDDIS